MSRTCPTDNDVAISRIQTETPCEQCGYILRSQAVRRDPATGLLTLRCPECGVTHPAEGISLRITRWRKWLGRRNRIRVLLAVLVELLGVPLCGTMNHLATLPGGGGRESRIIVLLILTGLFAAVQLAASASIYRLHTILRIVILLLGPVLALRFFDSLVLLTAFGWLVLAVQLLVTIAVGVWCRALLRGLVRIGCPNASRFVFEGLWRVEGKLVARGPW